jgi:hypothetical protein
VNDRSINKGKTNYAQLIFGIDLVGSNFVGLPMAPLGGLTARLKMFRG